MIVDVRKSRVGLECNCCHQPIEAGTYRLRWSRKQGDFTNKYFYHCEPDCWMEERIWYADQRPVATGDVGRPRMKITNEEREERVRATKRKWWDENRRKA